MLATLLSASLLGNVLARLTAEGGAGEGATRAGQDF